MTPIRVGVLAVLLACGVAFSEPPEPRPGTPRPIAPEAPLEPSPSVINPSVINPVVTNPVVNPRVVLVPPAAPRLPFREPAAGVKPTDIVISNPAKPVKIPTPSANSVALESRRVLGVYVKVVRVNLENPKVRVLPVLPLNVFRRGAQFDALVSGSSAVAVLNAGHFHPRTFSPVGDLIYNGRYLNRGRLRTGLAITASNEAQLWLRPYSPNPRGLETLIGTGPLLIQGGKINPVPKAEGYTDPAIWGLAARTAVGIISKKKLVFVSTRQRLSLRQLATVMKALGARDAIALDGGSSVGFAWRGQVLIHPKRKIAFGVGVYIRK